MKEPRILIIGAGPCGLGAGWRLKELGIETFRIYEKENHVGGLASSYIDSNGFTWDTGGHVLHSHYPYFDAMFEKVMKHEYFTHQRESWIWLYDRFIPYPFQNNIHRLPEKERNECLDGLKKATSQKSKKLHNFSDWIRVSFGLGIAKHFLYPYNKKVWAYPLEKMNFAWVGDRVSTVDIKRIENNIRLNKDDVSWGPNALFHFPKHGGTGDIWERVASYFPKQIYFNKQVRRIDSKKKKVFFSDDTNDAYDELLTTIPLNELTGVIEGITFPSSHPLHFSKVSVVGIGIHGLPPENLRHKCWIYFPQAHAPFFRATVFSNYSKCNAPQGAWSLMTEITSSHYRVLPQGDIKTIALKGALRNKLIPVGSKIDSLWLFEANHGYPTPTLGRDAYLDKVLPLLKQHNIYSRGRFGAWKYEVSNQDHAFMQGVEWVNYIIEEKDEITVCNPSLVNKK
jgi:protoporphyrinogen oxidase